MKLKDFFMVVANIKETVGNQDQRDHSRKQNIIRNWDVARFEEYPSEQDLTDVWTNIPISPDQTIMYIKVEKRYEQDRS